MKDVLTFNFFLVSRKIKPVASFCIDSKEKLKFLDKMADIFSLNKLFSPEKQQWVMYGDYPILHSLEILLKKCKEMKQKELVEIIGVLCGIPECCIRKFLKFKAYKPKGMEEVYGDYKRLLKSREDPYKLIINKTTEEITVTKNRIFHIPCSPNCKETKKLFNTYKKEYENFRRLMRKVKEWE